MPSFWGGITFRPLSSAQLSYSPLIYYHARLHQHETRQTTGPHLNQDGPAAQASYAAMSLLCMLVMAALLGSRFHSIFDVKYWKSITLIRLLPYLLYFTGIAFNIASSLTILGLDMTKVPSCRFAMYVCLVFYVATKVCVQLFLIERAHAVRSKFKKRLDDYIWLAFMLVVICGFGTIAILAFLAPVAVVDPHDGECRIGLPRKSVMVLMTYDILINLALTGVFLVLLRPFLRNRTATSRPDSMLLVPSSSTVPLRPQVSLQRSTNTLGGKSADATTIETSSSETPLQPISLTSVVDPNTAHLKMLVGKSVFGTVVMLTATLINLTLLYKYKGEEHGWICFMCCLIDVTWSVTIIHLLTEGKKEEARRPSLVRHYDGTELRNERWRLAAMRRAYSEG